MSSGSPAIEFSGLASLVILLMSVYNPVLQAQTCSCAGAPLISSQNFATVPGGGFMGGLTWEYNNISSLYSGANELNNRTQERITNTALLELSYGISDRLSVTGTFTYIEKSRTTGLQTQGNSSTITTSGIGDGMVMMKYHLINQDLWNPYQFSLGVGAKIPFGTTSLEANNVALNADMQPGTGAWDGVGWMFVSRAIRTLNMNVFLNGSYRYTGTAERFNESDNYTFGNEFVAIAGVSGAMWDRWSYDGQIKFRSTTRDQLNDFRLPNTGGEWLSVKTGVGYQVHDWVNLRVYGELPVYQQLNGTQPTTSFVLSASVFFSFSPNQNGFIYGTGE
ncbi:hypothetical protein [Gracilimonas sediminicola]|uniref:MetA-pathway of phenol degradation n=1 Tax=Gracilimonas sediminicola TaxID=2952158 RepID=A0A9X2L152_9BACT|nr:hypothetical protein [Gracilimonas sediminicola]MCP9290259.1 hypothetical protein [Gracilimonas sediminicola]